MTSPTEAPHCDPVSIFAVLVIYRCAPLSSPSLRTLLTAACSPSSDNVRLHIRVADNTPGGQTVAGLPEVVEYLAYPDNPGLARPYNDACEAAEQHGYDWLLTLDQDTNLPVTFLSSMAAAARQYAPDTRVAAIVPHITDNGRPISPFCYQAGFLPRVLSPAARGLAPRHASAINSGSLLRCKTLATIGGYDPRFPLHNSDTRLYQLLDQAGKRVAIADVTVPHELSILDREGRISPGRYRHMLLDERHFWDRHMTVAARTERMVRLLGRYAKGYLRKEAAAFQSVTAAEIRHRLLTRRRTRLRQTTAARPSNLIARDPAEENDE